MTKISDGIRQIKNTDVIVNIVSVLLSVIIIYCLFNKISFIKITLIIFLVLLTFIVFNMDLSYIQRIEKEIDHPILRINTERFTLNPHAELARYMEDTQHYGNTWRIAIGSSCIICLLLIPIIQVSLVPIFPYLFLVIFCVVYHVWGWKSHHSHEFIFKSVIQACNYLEKNNIDKPFKQEQHI